MEMEHSARKISNKEICDLATRLCMQIEKFGASEDLTKASVLANELLVMLACFVSQKGNTHLDGEKIKAEVLQVPNKFIHYKQNIPVNISEALFFDIGAKRSDEIEFLILDSRSVGWKFESEKECGAVFEKIKKLVSTEIVLDNEQVTNEKVKKNFG